MKNYTLSILCSLSIWIVCMIPVPETPLSHISFIDKWTHFVMYGTLTAIIWFEYYRKRRRSIPTGGHELLCLGFFLPILQGVLIELAQAYLTTCRSGDWFDALCNTLGVMLGATVSALIFKCIKK